MKDDFDQLDKEIMSFMLNDASVTSEELAKQLNTSAPTVRRRKKRLLDEKIIRLIAVPDWKKIGLPIVAIIAMEVNKNKLDSVLQILKKNDGCTWACITSGQFSLLSVWQVSSTEDIYLLMRNEIGQLEGIIRTEILIGLRTVKTFK